MDVYSVGATLRALLDPATDTDGAVTELLGSLTAAAPSQRPTPEVAMAALVRHAGDDDARPWPGWADSALLPPAGEEADRGPPGLGGPVPRTPVRPQPAVR
jgi:hypothetical protein